MKKIKSLLLVLLLTVILVGCKHSHEKQLQVAYTSYPVGYLVNSIIGDVKDIKVGGIIKEGGHIHDHESHADELVHTHNAELIFAFTNQLESFLEKNKEQYKKSNIIYLNETIDKHYINKRQNIEDPHSWMDVKNMITFAKEILKELSIKFPKHKQAFSDNYNKLFEKLEALDKKLLELKNLGKKEVLVDHDAFNYFSKRYGFKKKAVFPNPSVEELSPSEKTDLINYIKSNKLKYIAKVEEEGLSKDGKTLLSDASLGLKEIKLYSIETRTAEDISANHDYIWFMEENLKTIKGLAE